MPVIMVATFKLWLGVKRMTLDSWHLLGCCACSSRVNAAGSAACTRKSDSSGPLQVTKKKAFLLTVFKSLLLTGSVFFKEQAEMCPRLVV